MAHTPPAETSAPPAPATKKDRTHWLYIAVIASVVLGAAVGLLFPEFGKSLKPLGDGFVSLIKMMIGPVIFCTIALGVGSIAKAATVGRVGGIALVYFMAMSTFALAVGLVVGNLIHPGEGLKLTPYDPNKPQAAVDGTVQFLLDIIPGSLPVLPTLFIALLVGFGAVLGRIIEVTGGAQVLADLGLSTQTPVTPVLSAGVNGKKTLKVGNRTVTLKHAPGYVLRQAGTPAGDALAALHHLGRQRQGEGYAVLARVDARTFERLLELRPTLPGWLADLITTHARGASHAGSARP
mgnify:CR=1 FL=1